jgi:hypothetical protein
MFVLVLQVALPFVGCVQSVVMQQPDTGMQFDPHCL